MRYRCGRLERRKPQNRVLFAKDFVWKFDAWKSKRAQGLKRVRRWGWSQRNAKCHVLCVGEGARQGGYGDTITADGKPSMSIHGWQAAAVVGDYTLNFLEESESEDGTRSNTETYELYYKDERIWTKGTTWHRALSGMFGSKLTVELKAGASDGSVTLASSEAPANGGEGTTETWTLVEGTMTAA